MPWRCSNTSNAAGTKSGCCRRRTVKPGENIVAQGAQARAGDELIAAGTRFGPRTSLSAAACGCAALEVFARPRVAILTTGDELVARRVLARTRPDSQLQRSHAGRPGGRGGRRALDSAHRHRPGASPRCCSRASRSKPTFCSSPAASPRANSISSNLPWPASEPAFISPAFASSPANPRSSASYPAPQSRRAVVHAALLRPSRQPHLVGCHLSALCRARAGSLGRQC